MADEFDTDWAEDGRSAGSAPREGKRGPSVLLLLSGILALVVSGWALAGGNGWPGEGVDGPNLGWILVVAAIIVGALLVFTPSKR
ncbi:hypothetical protein [Aldersonia kunmingensis]|uniref:hypothetical protein n=1 Tax=Aldersonia kunmingensis TaxID=408066 RepID=UPI000A06CAFC|nr:hypothetical protein [Aldersonia kunmingensis]